MRDAAALILLQMDKQTKIGALADGPLELDKIDASVDAGTALDGINVGPAGIFAIGGIDDGA